MIRDDTRTDICVRAMVWFERKCVEGERYAFDLLDLLVAAVFALQSWILGVFSKNFEDRYGLLSKLGCNVYHYCIVFSRNSEFFKRGFYGAVAAWSALSGKTHMGGALTEILAFLL